MAPNTLILLLVGVSVALGFTFTPTCRCGLKGAERIINGVNAGLHEWPWMAGILSGSSLFCGGALINDRYVLTAAHCVSDSLPSDINVRLNEHTLSLTTETQRVSRTVSKIIVHSGYVPGDEVNDIALLQLSTKVEVSADVLPVCLPPAGPTYANKTATVTGWGLTSEEATTVSDVLMKVSVPVLKQSQCVAKYGAAITPTMMCAGVTGKDSCQGDSGGPLVWQNATSGAYAEIGVVSWGEGCARPERPGVYTRVNRYLSWIDSNTKDGVYCTG